MSRLLLTAFEPFDDSGINSSLEACHAFLRGGPGDVRFLTLPVVYGEDTRRMEEALAEESADAILHCGQSGGGVVCVERFALNWRYAASPLEQVRAGCAEHYALEAGPAAYFATWDADAVVAALRAAEVPARASAHAGVYLCNHVLYHSLHRAAHQPAPPRVGFLHLPRLPEQLSEEERHAEAPSLPLATLQQAVEIACAVLAPHVIS